MLLRMSWALLTLAPQACIAEICQEKQGLARTSQDMRICQDKLGFANVIHIHRFTLTACVHAHILTCMSCCIFMVVCDQVRSPRGVLWPQGQQKNPFGSIFSNVVAGSKTGSKCVEYVLNSSQICMLMPKFSCPVHIFCISVFIMCVFYRSFLALWSNNLQ